MVIDRVKDSYAGHFRYDSDSVHEAIEKHSVLEMLVGILTKEMPEYTYTLTFNAKDGKFSNELLIKEDGIKGQDNTRDSFINMDEEGVDRGDS